MKTLISYLLSKNKKVYAEIARQNGCSKVKVCDLAHGGRARTSQDYDVIRDLIERGIVSGYRTI